MPEAAHARLLWACHMTLNLNVMWLMTLETQENDAIYVRTTVIKDDWQLAYSLDWRYGPVLGKNSW